MTENPFNPNITFTISEVEEHNPFTPILGQGGYNSGRKIKSGETPLYPIDPNPQRDRVIWTNAQRTYRNRNRDAYNANMLELWKTNRKKKNDSYENWLLNQSKANEKYRLKKKLEKLEGVNYNDLKTVPSKIKTAVDKSWKAMPKSERDKLTKNKKIKVGDYKPELYKEEFEKTRLAEIETIKAKLGNNTKIQKGKFLQVEKNGRKVNSKLADPNYVDVDYKGLEVGADEDRRKNNLKDLEIYHKSVLTTQKPIPNTLFDTNRKYKLSNLAKVRKSHRDNLHAGDWTLKGQYKRNSGNPSNRPEEERYEKKGENKI